MKCLYASDVVDIKKYTNMIIDCLLTSHERKNQQDAHEMLMRMTRQRDATVHSIKTTWNLYCCKCKAATTVFEWTTVYDMCIPVFCSGKESVLNIQKLLDGYVSNAERLEKPTSPRKVCSKCFTIAKSNEFRTPVIEIIQETYFICKVETRHNLEPLLNLIFELSFEVCLNGLSYKLVSVLFHSVY